MPKNDVIKRLVEEVGDIEVDEEGDIPIEYYEMRDLAKTIVILKSSIKAHALIFGLINILLLLSNFFADPRPIENIYDVWALWVLLGWGLLLWSHIWIVFCIIKLDIIDRKIFAIISLILAYLAGLLIYVNYVSNHFANLSYLWWPWTTAGIGLVIGIYAYFVYETEDREKMQNRIKKEMMNLRNKKMKMNES